MNKSNLNSLILGVFIFYTSIVFSQLPNNVPSNGLIGWWPFSGNANDESGNGNHGTVNGATLTTDRFNASSNAYDFTHNGLVWNSGLHQLINVPYSSTFNSNAISVSLWFNARSYFFNGIPGNDKWSRLIGRVQNGYSNPNGETWLIDLNNGKVLAAVEDTGLYPNQTSISVESNISLDVWNHVVMTFDNISLKLFLNGNLVSEIAKPSNFIFNTIGTSGISIGSSNQANGYWYESDAKIDDIGIWNRALTPQEISNLYNPCTIPSPPVGSPSQIFCTTPLPTIANLSATGSNIQWYETETGGTPLASTTALVDGNIYYASQTINGCESTTRLAVTVDFNDPQITASETTICSGTAVSLSVNYDLFLNTENYSFFGEFEGQSYFISINPINYSLASNYNLTNGVDFLTITSQNENDFITSNSLPGFLWLGCSDLSIEGQWEWLNNENFNYSNWDIGEPNNQAGGEDYAEFKINGFWNDIPLIDNGNEVLRYHMFETSFSSSILWSTGEITQNINVNPTTTATYWVDVTVNGVTCRKEITINVNSSTPAPIGNATQVFCTTPLPTIANLSATGSNIQWYETETGGTPLASTTTLVEGTTYYASQTINGCESTTRLSVNVLINNPSISSTNTTICEGDEIELTVNYNNNLLCNMNITPSSIPLGNPIPGFTYGGVFNGHYYYVYNTPTSWTDGELICRQNGGYLVCINDINENSFVSNLTNNNIWIGMFRDPNTCEFRWLDCMDITFTNWRPGEPNSGPCGEPYVQIIRGCSFGLNTWNNLDNNSSNGPCYSNMVPIMEIDPLYYNNQTQTSILWSTGETTPTISPTPTETTEYWVDVTINGVTCRKYITINVTSNSVPEFTQVAPICSGATLSALPTTSINGVTGTWSPALNNTATTTYTFTPDAGQCASVVTMEIVINQIPPAPTGDETQVFCTTPLPTIANLSATGSNIQWYETETGGTPLASTTTLVEGTTYYASQTINDCESTSRLAVTFDLNDPQITASATTVCSGTQVNLQVNVVPNSNSSPIWELLIPSTSYNGSQINLSETGYDRANNHIFSIFKQGSNTVIYRFNLNDNTVSNISTSNIPANIGPFTFDYTNNRLITGRTGRESIFGVSANGGSWTQIGSGSSDQESYGAQYYWNPNNQKTGFFGGYGFFAVKNWIWENGGSWVNTFSNNNNCGTTIPAKRNTQLALGAPNANKIYFFSGQGSCSGQQTATSCNLGSPWASDVGIYCWLKDLWELDLTNHTFNNILPVNSSSVTKEGNIVYNYNENTFYIVGGYVPSPTYNSNNGNTTNFETSVLKYDISTNTGFEPFTVQGTPPPLVSLNNLGNQKSYYDGVNNQIVWIRKDGVWAIKLGNSNNNSSIIWSTGETTPTISPTPTETTEYWVDVTINGVTCRKYITINVTPNSVPEFTQLAPICSGATLTTLPTTSNNGITGTWSPELNNTATTTYTFTPTTGQCATTATMTIAVNPNITPTFTQVAPICSGTSLTALPTTSINGITGSWSPTMNNTATTTYTFTPTAGQCATTATMTISVNPNITPTFTQVAPICSGATLAPLPTTSNNGITGTWSPGLNNTATTTYTFTPTAGQCATTATMTITVNPNITPTFTQVAPICSGATLAPLPTTSNNGITGTWSPGLNNTATTTYTFTPTAGQCATTASMTITVNPLPADPVGNSNQIFCKINNPRVGDILITPSNVIWYNSSSGGQIVPNTTLLTNGMVLYAENIDSVTGCKSINRFAVQIELINPELPNLPGKISFCFEDNPTIASLSTFTNGYNVNWYSSPTGGFILSSNYVLQDGEVIYGESIETTSGCVSTSRILLEVEIVNSDLTFNNYISVDGNSINEKLKINGIEKFENNSLEVYNRYGNLVWKTANYNNENNSFKGMSNVSGVISRGSYLPTGTYYFILTYPNDCIKSELKGFIHIDNKL